MVTVSFCPEEIDLCVVRGDSPVLAFTINAVDENSDAVTLTNAYTFLLTVDPSPSPTDSSNNLFQLTGSVLPNNRVIFQPNSANLDVTPSVYFYDLQMTTPIPSVRTVVKGQIEVQQDVTK